MGSDGLTLERTVAEIKTERHEVRAPNQASYEVPATYELILKSTWRVYWKASEYFVKASTCRV